AGIAEVSVLFVAASAEYHSDHPLAHAIVKCSIYRSISTTMTANFEAIRGYGIQTVVEEKNIFIGTRSLMIEQQLEISGDMEETMEKLEKDGKTAMLIGTKEQVAGVIAVADTVKETSQEAIDRMRNHGLDVILLTGDNE